MGRYILYDLYNKVKEWFMGIFIGDNATEKVLHVYNGTSTIKRDNFSGTAFHSSLPYSNIVSIHRFTPSGSPYIVADSYNFWAEKQNYTTDTAIPTGDHSIIVRGSISGVIYTFPTQIGVPDIADIQAVYFGNPVTNGPALCLTSLSSGFTARSWFRHSSYTTFPIQTFDFIDVYVFTQTIEPITASDIRISNSEFTVNSENVFDKRFVHMMGSLSDRINDYDTIIPISTSGTGIVSSFSTSTSNLNHTTSGTVHYIQIINGYDYPVDSVTMQSNPSSIGTVKNGNNVISFTESTPIRTTYTAMSDFRVIHYGETTSTKLLRSMAFTAYDNQTLVFHALFTKNGFTTLKDTFIPLPSTAGSSFVLMGSYKYYIKGVVNASRTAVDFYVIELGFGWATFVTDIDVSVYELH